ncbi:hypothetical protein KC19_12G101200, partial [Ceratodon purpureus]
YCRPNLRSQSDEFHAIDPVVQTYTSINLSADFSNPHKPSTMWLLVVPVEPDPVSYRASICFPVWMHLNI